MEWQTVSVAGPVRESHAMIRRTIYFLLCTVRYLLLLAGMAGVIWAGLGIIVIGFAESPVGIPFAGGINLHEFLVRLVLAVVVWSVLWVGSALAAAWMRGWIADQEANTSAVSFFRRHRWARSLHAVSVALTVTAIVLVALAFVFRAHGDVRQLLMRLSAACFVGTFAALVVASYIEPISRDS